jgi:hypothetical protein
MKPKWLHVLRLLKLLLKLVVALVKVEISLNTSQRMGVVNLVITYKIDGGIDFILHFYLL